MNDENDRKRAAKAAYDHALIMSNPVGLCHSHEYQMCEDAIKRNAGREEGKCGKCLAQPYLCSYGGREGLMVILRKANNYGEIVHTATYQLLVWEMQRYADTGVLDLPAYVTKAEELGLGEKVAYWKLQLLDEKIDKLKDKLNELITKVNQK